MVASKNNDAVSTAHRRHKLKAQAATVPLEKPKSKPKPAVPLEKPKPAAPAKCSAQPCDFFASVDGKCSQCSDPAKATKKAADRKVQPNKRPNMKWYPLDSEDRLTAKELVAHIAKASIAAGPGNQYEPDSPVKPDDMALVMDFEDWEMEPWVAEVHSVQVLRVVDDGAGTREGTILVTTTEDQRIFLEWAEDVGKGTFSTSRSK